MEDRKKLIAEVFKIADYDYKQCKTATVSFPNDSRYYDLLPMLDNVEDIKKVIYDLKYRKAFICPF